MIKTIYVKKTIEPAYGIFVYIIYALEFLLHAECQKGIRENISI